MKLTVLVDNNTYIDAYYLGEPGASYYIEDNGTRILFDTGYSDIFLKNAAKLNIDLRDLDYIVLSHGHNDHTWGLKHYIQFLQEEGLKKKIKLLAHPHALLPKKTKEEEIGNILSPTIIGEYFDLVLRKEPYWLTDKLVFLGEIKRGNSFEGKKAMGETLINGQIQDDYLLDDTALAYKGEKGLGIITGCSHAGICNIVEQAKFITNMDQVSHIMGGLHLLKPEEPILNQTITYLKNLKLPVLHACHCTDFYSKCALAQEIKLAEVGVGLKINF
jgi:7,8-dihydropterin-6-yl-methyl-4-(beta-D-ribofuranosyl)aminobenzene 5'-phosphate synthase